MFQVWLRPFFCLIVGAAGWVLVGTAWYENGHKMVTLINMTTIVKKCENHRLAGSNKNVAWNFVQKDYMKYMKLQLNI